MRRRVQRIRLGIGGLKARSSLDPCSSWGLHQVLEGPLAVPIMFIGIERVQHVEQFKYLGQIYDSHGTVKGEVSRRLGLGYAALNTLGNCKQEIWIYRTLSRRTKLTIYKPLS
jgi:hypothetical protein